MTKQQAFKQAQSELTQELDRDIIEDRGMEIFVNSFHQWKRENFFKCKEGWHVLPGSQSPLYTTAELIKKFEKEN